MWGNNHHVLRLGSDNYQLWKHQMRLVLKSKKLWSVIEGENPEDKDLSDLDEELDFEEKKKAKKELMKYIEKSTSAAAIMLPTLEPGQAQQVDDGREIWNKLIEIHEEKISTRRVDLGLELSTIKRKMKKILNHISPEVNILKIS